MTAKIIFTIGHSNRTLAAFLSLLTSQQIAEIVDVRSAPSSRAMPHFNGPALAAALADAGIGYRHAPDLGGHRKTSDVPAQTNGYWHHASFRNYADYALSAPFQAALQVLLKQSAARRNAIMCAEAVWWRCHRRIISDYLLARGRRVRHILSPTNTRDAQMTTAAQPRTDGLITYPADPSSGARQ